MKESVLFPVGKPPAKAGTVLIETMLSGDPLYMKNPWYKEGIILAKS